MKRFILKYWWIPLTVIAVCVLSILMGLLGLFVPSSDEFGRRHSIPDGLDVWFGNQKLKLASSVFFFVLSLLLIPISFFSTWYVAFTLAGILLSILSFIKYYREMLVS